MRHLIKKAEKELARRILAEEYENFKIETSTHSSYVCEVNFEIEGHFFHYSVAPAYVCDHSEVKLPKEDFQEVIDYFLQKYEEVFNTEEMKQDEIKRLEERIKELKSK